MARESKLYRGFNTAERIISLIDSTEESYKTFEKKLGLKPGTVSEWKRGRMTNYMDYIVDIADELGTTTDWILGRVDDDLTGLINVFVQGTISGGRLIEKFEISSEYIQLSSESAPQNTLIAYRVIGDAFLPIAMNNDIIIIEKNSKKQSDRLCLITFDNETSIKRIKLSKDSVTIYPINPMENEIQLKNQKALERGFYIEGTIFQMIRNF